MEPVAPNAVALAPCAGKRVGGGLGRERRVEGGVEARDLRHVRQRSSDRVERGQRLGLMKRRERRQLAELGLDVLVDDHRIAKALASVNDPVPGDVGGGGQLGESGRHDVGLDHSARCRELTRPELAVVRVEQRQLQAARPGVHHQHAHVWRYPGTPRAGSSRADSPPGHVQSRTSGGSSPCSRV